MSEARQLNSNLLIINNKKAKSLRYSMKMCIFAAEYH